MQASRSSAALAAITVALLAGGAAAAEKPFRIGINAERTGNASSYGEHMLIAAQLALEKINAAGGVAGHPIEFVIEDNRSSPEQAVIATRTLGQSGVVAILGPVQSSQARTAFPATNREEVVSISPGSGAPGLTAKNRPWSFRNAAIDQFIIDETVAVVRARHAAAKNVVMTLDPKDAYEKFLVTAVSPPPLEKNGFTIVNRDAPIEVPTNTDDFSVFVTKAKAMNPDLLLLGLVFEQGKGFLKEANRQKLMVPMFSGIGYVMESVAEAAGDITVFSGQPFDPDTTEPEGKAFVEAFRKRSAQQLPGQYTTPTYIDAGAYESVMIMAEALRKSGLKPDDAPAKLRAAVRDYMAGLKDFKGLGNTLYINAEGDAVKPTLIYYTEKGQWKRVK